MPIAIVGLAAGAVLLWLGWRRGARADRANAALRAAMRAAEDDRQAMSRLLAMVGHDLRQPLQALTLHVSLLDPHLQSPAGRELLGVTDYLVQSMTQTMTALVALQRLEAGELTAEAADFPVGELLEDAAARCGGEAGQGKISVRADPAIRVRADPDMLETVLSCLAAHILGRSETRRAVLEARSLDGQVSIEVHGGDADHVWQGEGAANFEGANFGLAIVVRLTRRLGYRLHRQSLPDEGEAFRILLPAAAG